MPNYTAIERKWQGRWEEAKLFRVTEDPKRTTCYILEMYPYPSGSGLHMGHARNYCIGDVYARFKRMNGFNVLYPMGYDSFGLPAENAAIKAKSHPQRFTEEAIRRFIRQQKGLGLSYDWDRMIASHTPEYYRWDQWIFLKMLEKGLAYKKRSVVNWCPECQTVLANEQVHAGKCWRHEETDVEVKDLEQWFFRITDYAEELLDGIGTLDGWSDDVKTMQRNWIGRSEGAEISFPIEGSGKRITVFTTRPDTFFGITFLVYAPEHPDVLELVRGTKYETQTKAFIRKVVLEDRFLRTAEDREKEGMFIGRYATNPITGERIPLYIANFVLHEYGTGAIIAVPAHDERDFQFAKKYGIPIKVVINPPDFDLDEKRMNRAYVGDGAMVNSGEFDGMNNRDAIPEFARFFEKHGCGKATVQYKLRDWLISRQRFWGCPIPIVYCDACGIVPVPEKDLPVRLPDGFAFTSGKGNPLEQCESFVKTACPTCGRPARRETDTMDTFVDSSWYFLRYCDPANAEMPFDPKKAAYWMPIDTYIGGKEHATMHLIYFRFFTKFLRDLGLLRIDEPTKNLFNQGMLHKGGVVMSKSKGNVVSQEEIAARFGIDTARFFLMFVAGPEKDMEWDDQAVAGSYRFLNKVHALGTGKKVVTASRPAQLSRLHAAIRDVTADISSFRYNIALIRIMEIANYLAAQEDVSREALEGLVLLMAPFTPHLAEELWEHIGNKGFVSVAPWPKHDETRIDKALIASEDYIKRVQADVRSVLEIIKAGSPKRITLIVADAWKHDLVGKVRVKLEETHDVSKIIPAVMDKAHAKEIPKIVSALVKNPSRIPLVMLGAEGELKAAKAAIPSLTRGFGCEAQALTETVAAKKGIAKAAGAMPGKCAIHVEK
ncbi:leucine--tRNA ligase [Candidatus Woesearchaeota archaeon]|nr:leucine--tRNA ligase [Candidatus Woesearchaeota archaeon]